MYKAQAGRVLSASRHLPSGVAIAILALLIIVGLFYALNNRPDLPANPTTAFAAAFDRLGEMESVHFSVEEDLASGPIRFSFTNLGVLDIEISEHYFPADWDAFERQTEEDCIIRDGTYRLCIIRKRGTGEEVGRIERGFAERATTVGALVRPDSVHYTVTRKTDRPLQLSGTPGVNPAERPAAEFVYVDGVTWARTVGDNPYWHVSNIDGSLGPLERDLFFWGLLDASVEEGPILSDRYVGVEQLEDTDLGGIQVERYLTKSIEGSQVVEVWVGKEDGLVRMISVRMDGVMRWGPISSERTYTFSRFNEPVDIPTPWPCFGAPHC